MLTKDQIMAVNDLPMAKVAVPQWGGDVYVKSMTGAERDRWESEWTEWRKANGTSCFQAFLIVHVVCNEDKTPLFTRDDVRSLNDKSAKAIASLYRHAARMNGIGADEDESAEKN